MWWTFLIFQKFNWPNKLLSSICNCRWLDRNSSSNNFFIWLFILLLFWAPLPSNLQTSHATLVNTQAFTYTFSTLYLSCRYPNSNLIMLWCKSNWIGCLCRSIILFVNWFNQKAIEPRENSYLNVWPRTIMTNKRVCKKACYKPRILGGV